DREQRAPHVRHALPVQRPAHLLVEVRDPELPEDRRAHDVTLRRRYVAAAPGSRIRTAGPAGRRTPAATGRCQGWPGRRRSQRGRAPRRARAGRLDRVLEWPCGKPLPVSSWQILGPGLGMRMIPPARRSLHADAIDWAPALRAERAGP